MPQRIRCARFEGALEPEDVDALAEALDHLPDCAIEAPPELRFVVVTFDDAADLDAVASALDVWADAVDATWRLTEG